MESSKLFTKNKYGITIVKCCASCSFKKIDNRMRICMAGEGAVPASYVCQNWQMSPDYEKVGKGGGKIKKYEYLQYILNRLEIAESEAITAASKGLFYRRPSIAEIHEDYMKEYGDIYCKEE